MKHNNWSLDNEWADYYEYSEIGRIDVTRLISPNGRSNSAADIANNAVATGHAFIREIFSAMKESR